MAMETLRQNYRLTDDQVNWADHDALLSNRQAYAAPTNEEDQLGLVYVTPNQGADTVVVDLAGFNENPLDVSDTVASWTARRNAMLAEQTGSIVVAPAVPGTFLEVPDAQGIEEGTPLSRFAMTGIQHETLERGSFRRLAEGMTQAALTALVMAGVSLDDKKLIVMGGSQGASTAAAVARALLEAERQPDGMYIMEPVALAPVPHGLPGLAKRFFVPAEQNVAAYVEQNPETTRRKELDEGGRAWRSRLLGTRAAHLSLVKGMAQGGIPQDLQIGDFDRMNVLLAHGRLSGLSPEHLNVAFEEHVARTLGAGAIERVAIEESHHPIGVMFSLSSRGIDQLAA